jgi:hypothetical protein
MADDLPDPVLQLINAVNVGGSDAFVKAFSDNGVVDDWGREFRGHDAVRRWSDAELIGKNATLAVTNVSQEAEATVVTAHVGGDGFNGPSTFIFSTRNDLVVKMTITE